MSSKKGPCEYCSREGDKLEDEKGVSTEPVYVCKKCMVLLSKPETALPLIRGHLSFEVREGKISKKELDKFMEMIAGWGKLN